jgi:hypothetical protein
MLLKPAAAAENGLFREPARSVRMYVSTGSAETDHLQARIMVFKAFSSGGLLLPGAPRTA